MTFDAAKARKHAQRVLFHLTKAEGIREAGADPDGDMREAKRHLVEIANEFGCFLEPIEDAARTAVEGEQPAA